VTRFSTRVSELNASVFSSFAARLAQFEGPIYPLHVGDTWLEPAACGQVTQLPPSPELHHYTPVSGVPALREAVARRVAGQTHHPAGVEHVMIAPGATGTLSALLGAIVSPGDEVIIAAPAWPLVSGSVRGWGGTPVWVHVPPSPAELTQALDRAYTDRVVAIYVNAANNPTGQVLSQAHIEGIVAWARRRNVWILSDEVYEQLIFQGDYVHLRALAPERTAHVASFSKAYGVAGLRVGYAVAPAPWIQAALRVATNTTYCASRPSQEAALRLLSPEGDAWIAGARQAYARLAEEAAAVLGVAAPQCGTFLWVPIEGDLLHLLDRCVAQGLLVAPGTSFGPYTQHIRVCFTSVEPSRTLDGLRLLKGLL